MCSLEMCCVLSFPGKKKREQIQIQFIADYPKKSGNLAWGRKKYSKCAVIEEWKVWGKGEASKFSSKSSRKPKTRSCVYSSSHQAVTLPPPRSSCGIVGSATWSGTWRGVFCETQGGKGTTQSHHLHSVLILGSQLPSFYWESNRAGPLQWWSVFWVYQRCRFPCLQGHVIASQCIPASSQPRLGMRM